MKENIRTMVVDGDVYEIWTDVIARGTYAQCKKKRKSRKNQQRTLHQRNFYGKKVY